MEGSKSRGWIRWAILGGATILAIIGIIVVASQFGGKKNDGVDTVANDDSSGSMEENIKPDVESKLGTESEKAETVTQTEDLPKSGPENAMTSILIAGASAYVLSLGAGELLRLNKRKQEV